MLQFELQPELCTSCGQCVDDCLAEIIKLEAGRPAIAPDLQKLCFRCQHCMAICPTGAISILGLHPQHLEPIPNHFPAPEAIETLIRGRRSVRHYHPINLEPEILSHLLEVAWQAPTGKNMRQVKFTVIDDRDRMNKFRQKVFDSLDRLDQQNTLPANFSFLAEFVQRWKQHGYDRIFRGAPHLLIATAPAHAVTPDQDCLIALTTFDLFAQANGVGTVWAGYVAMILNLVLPELKLELDIPADHVHANAILFGKPAVSYARTVLHVDPLIHRVK